MWGTAIVEVEISALKASEWFRRGRLPMVSPVHGDCRRCQAEIPLIDAKFLFRQPGPVQPALLFFKLIKVETKFPFANSISEFSRSQDPSRTYTAREGGICQPDSVGHRIRGHCMDY